MKRGLFALYLLFLLTQIYAISLPGGVNITPTSIKTYESGELKYISFSEPIKIQTTIGAIEFINELYFHKNGNIMNGTMKDKYWVNTASYGKFIISGDVYFFPSGNLKYCKPLVYRTSIQGSKVSVSGIGFNDEGIITEMEFNDSTIIDREGNSIQILKASFYPDGKIKFISDMLPIVIKYDINKYTSVYSIYYTDKFTAYLPLERVNIGKFYLDESVFLVFDEQKKLQGGGYFNALQEFCLIPFN